MAHFAKLDESNIVITIIVIANEELLENGVELESKGVTFCQALFDGNWIQTSYNGNIRKNYAGIGFTYDEGRDAFIAPKANCHTEEVLDEATCRWTCSNAEHTEIIND